jgi:hypothetical protein
MLALWGLDHMKSVGLKAMKVRKFLREAADIVPDRQKS